jgi:S-methylmethionine-dependent homocysteine/selenocysteine methylase
MPLRSIVERLTDGDVLILDGATGSELQRRGVDVNRGATSEELGVWSATANVEAPEVVRAVHEDYLHAGADIITSNNFYTTREMLKLIDEEDRWEEYTRRGGEIAVRARDAVNPEAYVAGGFAPPYQGDLRSEFEGQARVLAEVGVDFLLAEYMAGDTVLEDPIRDCIAAIDVCAATGLPAFVGVSNLTDEGTLLGGGTLEQLATELKGQPVAGLFLMCSFPAQISAGLPRLRSAFDGPIGCYAHLGYDRNPRFGESPDEPYYLIDRLGYTPDRYAECAADWKKIGAQVIGGCCATGPDHIAALRGALVGKN